MANFLCLRGLSRAKGHWGYFPKAFEAQLGALQSQAQIEEGQNEVKGKGEGHQLFFIDGPGNGDFVHLDSPKRLPEYTDFIRQQWAQLKSSGQVTHPSAPFWLVGISLGGMISFDWLKRFPEEVQGLVVINSSLSDLSGALERFQLKNIPKVLEILALPMSPEKVEAKILKLTTGLLSTKEQSYWARTNSQVPQTRRANFFRQISAAKNYRFQEFEKVKTYGKPILVVIGEQDGLVDPRCGKKIAAHFDASLISHPDGGHDLPLEVPDWLAFQICEFFKTHRQNQR